MNQEVLKLSLAATQHLEMSENLDDSTAFHELLEKTLLKLREKTGGRVEELNNHGPMQMTASGLTARPFLDV